MTTTSGSVAPEDVVDLLGPVEVDDGHDDGPEVGGGPEGDAGLDPVRQLEHDDVAGADAPGPQRAGERAGPPGRRRRRCRATAGPSSAPGTARRPSRPRPSATIVAEGGVGPPALGDGSVPRAPAARRGGVALPS